MASSHPFGMAALITVLLLLAGCEGGAAEPPAAPNQISISETGTGTETGGESPVPNKPEAVVPPPAEAVLVAVGDIMMHTPQLPGAFDVESGTYDFTGFFAPLHDDVTEADWAVANLETPIAGDDRGFRGYPMFNAPIALSDAIEGAGFDIVSTANNHSLDQGFTGLVHTLETLRSKGLVPVGTAESEEAAASFVTVEKNGISNAFLSYTYGTNGIPIPADKPFSVNLIDDARIADDIGKARASGADIVTVSLHFGNEYQRKPSDEQRRVARLSIEAGADLVIGHHPHVVQPYEYHQVAEADGTLRSGLIMYSLGNFISNQFGGYKEYGALLKVTFRKTYQADGTAVTAITKVDTIPTWVHKYVSGGKSRYRVLSLDEIAEAGDDPLLTPRLLSTLTAKAAEMNRHLESLLIEADADHSVSSNVYR